LLDAIAVISAVNALARTNLTGRGRGLVTVGISKTSYANLTREIASRGGTSAVAVRLAHITGRRRGRCRGESTDPILGTEGVL